LGSVQSTRMLLPLRAVSGEIAGAGGAGGLHDTVTVALLVSERRGMDGGADAGFGEGEVLGVAGDEGPLAANHGGGGGPGGVRRAVGGDL
jgi:hypothetical protein